MAPQTGDEGDVDLRVQVILVRSLGSSRKSPDPVSSPGSVPPTTRSPNSPKGQRSPPPRESPRRRDPEVNLDSAAGPCKVRFLPGRGLWGPDVAVETAALTAAMAAPGAVGRTAQRLEGTVSNESCITARTPVPVVSPESLDLPVSPVQVSELPSKNLWEKICEGRQPGPAERDGTRAARRDPRLPGAYCARPSGSLAAGPPGSPCYVRGN